LDSIHTIIDPTLSVELIENLGKLYDGNHYEIGELCTQMDFCEKANINLILSYLVHTGYLSYKEGQVSIPNQEIMVAWKNPVLGLTSQRILTAQIQHSIVEALTATPVDFKLLRRVMKEILLTRSCHDFKNENSYHLLFLGIF
jgi:hypothetical protein